MVTRNANGTPSIAVYAYRDAASPKAQERHGVPVFPCLGTPCPHADAVRALTRAGRP